MNISYDLWPIWCDYLEEQSQETDLLRYYFTWNFILPFVNSSMYNTIDIRGTYPECLYIFLSLGGSDYRGDGTYDFQDSWGVKLLDNPAIGSGINADYGDGY